MKAFFGVLLISFNCFAGSSILFIGDSQSVGPFGQQLHHDLSQHHQIETYAVCGAIGEWWFTGKRQTCGSWSKIQDQGEKMPRYTPSLPSLISRIKPDYVIMQFGGNYRYFENPDDLIPDVRKLIAAAKANGAKCMFVTGPDTKVGRDQLPGIVDRIKFAVGGDCGFFNSLEVTEYPDRATLEVTPERKFKADGKHYNFLPEGEPLARKWAQFVFESFLRFKAETPNG